jgi:hypothetical protein
MASGIYGALERTKELFKKEKKWLLQQEQMQVRRPAMLKLSLERLRKRLSFCGNHGNEEMKLSAHLMEKGLGAWLDPDFETRLPNKESGPFNMTVEDEKNQKEAVEMNKKAMCQFIQAFATMSLLSKVNAKESRQALSKWKSMETVG